MGRESSAVDFRSVGARCSNGGRWGADDERGTRNEEPHYRSSRCSCRRRNPSGQGVRSRYQLRREVPTTDRPRSNPVRLMSETGYDFETLAVDCADDGAWEGFLSAPVMKLLSRGPRRAGSWHRQVDLGRRSARLPSLGLGWIQSSEPRPAHGEPLPRTQTGTVVKRQLRDDTRVPAHTPWSEHDRHPQ